MNQLSHAMIVLSIIWQVMRRNLILLFIFDRDGKAFARQLSKAISRLGPAFIKTGQALSTRPDIVGAKMAAALSVLQDKLPPFSTSQVKKIILRDFGSNPDKLFKSFNDKPVAAASIAQVHQAVTVDGEIVAVKILRPGIRGRFNRDHQFLIALARFLEANFSTVKQVQLVEVLELLDRNLKIELDLTMEAATASQLADNLQHDHEVVIPKILWGYTSKDIMTSEWVDGISISKQQLLVENGFDLRDLSKKLAITFFNMAYRDGFFHADMHPGNIFVNSEGKIVLVDFGIVGKLSRRDRMFVAELLHGFITYNYAKVAKAHFRYGLVSKRQSLIDFTLAIRSISEPIIGKSVAEISVARLLESLFKLTNNFAMQTRPELLLLQKAIMLVEGVGLILNPNINMWRLAEPWIEKWAVKNLSPEAQAIEAGKKLLNLAVDKIMEY
ncbi:MAG: 2-polyprenylphenol 6-hydroxylase [Pseudomonadota bacterium]